MQPRPLVPKPQNRILGRAMRSARLCSSKKRTQYHASAPLCVFGSCVFFFSLCFRFVANLHRNLRRREEKELCLFLKAFVATPGFGIIRFSVFLSRPTSWRCRKCSRCACCGIPPPPPTSLHPFEQDLWKKGIIWHITTLVGLHRQANRRR